MDLCEARASERGGSGREAAVEKHRRVSEAEQFLQAWLPELAGSTWVCHCQAHERCRPL